MAIEISAVEEAIRNGQTLAAADQVLIDPQPGALTARVDELLSAIQNNECPCRRGLPHPDPARHELRGERRRNRRLRRGRSQPRTSSRSSPPSMISKGP